MNWFAIIRLILQIISQLPFDADEPQVKAAVQEELAKQNTVAALSEVNAAPVTPEELEELIAHIVAILMFFIRRRSDPSI